MLFHRDIALLKRAVCDGDEVLAEHVLERIDHDDDGREIASVAQKACVRSASDAEEDAEEDEDHEALDASSEGAEERDDAVTALKNEAMLVAVQRGDVSMMRLIQQHMGRDKVYVRVL